MNKNIKYSLLIGVYNNMIIIERYLFLLEDAEYDELDKKWKELRKKVMKLGNGPDGGDRLSSLYPDKNKRPPDVAKK